MLSTAIFEGAHAKILDLCKSTDLRMSSTTVVVLPVPGGPWIMATSLEIRHLLIARSCEELRPEL